MESIVFGFCEVLGLPAAAVPAISGADERKSGIESEVRAPELPMWVARAGAERFGGSEHAAASLGLGSGINECMAPHTSWCRAGWKRSGMRVGAQYADPLVL